MIPLNEVKATWKPFRTEPLVLTRSVDYTCVDLDMQDILSELYEPFDAVAPYLLSQVCRVVDRQYEGNGVRFLQEFLMPARVILMQLKEDSWLQLKHKPRDEGWPLCYHGNVVVHLCEIERESLCQGDYYLYLKPTADVSAAVSLTLQYLTASGSVKEVTVPSSTFREVFTRHWLRDVFRDFTVSSSAMDLRSSAESGCPRPLTSFVIAGELGLQREDWRDIVQPPVMERKLSSRKSKGQRSRGSGSGASGSGGSQQSSGRWRQSKQSNAREMRKIGPRNGNTAEDDSKGDNKGERHEEKLKLPQYILQVNFELLHSQAIILTGSRDSRGGAIVEVQGNNVAWCEAKYSLKDLCKVLGYLFAIPREEVRARGLSVAVDARSAPRSAMEYIAETLDVLEESYPGAIHRTVILIDTDSILGRFVTVYSKPKVNYKCEVVHSLDKLYQYVASRLLTEQFNGTFPYDHDSWIRFRMKLEPFVSGCQSAAKFLFTSMEEFTMTGDPQSASDINQAIRVTRTKHQDVYQDARMAGLHREGGGVLAALKNQDGPLALTEDFQDAMMCVSQLFDQVHQACMELDKLADKRLCALNQRLQLAAFEEQTCNVTEWMSKEGELHLCQMKEDQAESLGSILTIQKDFEKFYFTAMKHIGHGEDLLEDAQLLADSCGTERPDIKEMARSLRHQLKLFTDRLEDKRRYIEDAGKLYTMLDKAYEWALDGMKFVAILGHEKSRTREQCRVHLCTMEKYLRDNPPTSAETFLQMHALSKQLGKDKCIQQCDFAEKRCQESHGMIKDKIEKLRNMLRGPLRANLKDKSQDSTTSTTTTTTTNKKAIMLSERSSSAVFELLGDLTPQVGTKAAVVSGVAADSESALPSKVELLRKGIRSTTPKQHRDSLHSNGSVDSGISVGDKILERGGAMTSVSPTAVDSPSDFSVRQRKMAALIQPISEIVGNKERPVGSLEKLDEGYEEAETNAVMQETPSGTGQGRDGERGTYSAGLPGLPGKIDFGETPSADEGAVCRKANMEEEFQLSDDETPEETESHWSPQDANRHIRKSVSLAPGCPLKLETLPRNSTASGSSSSGSTHKDHPNYRRLVLILDEMIQTEQDFVLALKYIIDNYFPEMDRDDIAQGLRGQRSAVFGNLEKIYEFHDRHFLRALSSCQSDPMQVGQCFLQHKKGFGLYALYNKNKPRSDSLLYDYGDFFRAQQSKLGDRMDLASYLLKPVQRLGKYALLLKDLIRECQPTDQELGPLKSAEEMVQFQMRHGNDLLAMDSIKDCDVNLHEQGDLLRQDEFLVYRGHRKCVRHVFLFEDMILFSKTRRTARGHDVYNYKFSLKLTDIGMTQNIGESGLKFEIWFRRRKTSDKSYSLHAKSHSTKEQWTQDISKLLWKQAFKSKEARQVQLTSMGVGSKPCLDIKPNEGRINDRAINIMRHKAPRMRNSIAVSSFSPTQLLGGQYTISNLSMSNTNLSSAPQACRPLRSSLASLAIHGNQLDAVREARGERDRRSRTAAAAGKQPLTLLSISRNSSGSGSSVSTTMGMDSGLMTPTENKNDNQESDLTEI